MNNSAPRFAAKALALALCTVAYPALAAAASEDADASESRQIVVTGAAQRETPSATGLALTLRETPQSVTVIDRQRIEDFALNNVNDLLAQAVGINVERVETDRTEYTSRGFDVTNFQIDGIGLPLRWGIAYGETDTALYERVEAIRGANALMTGVGNPSATINYVRKRPTKDFHLKANAQVGSWNQWRVDGDVSGSVTKDGKLSLRLIYAHDQRDSYLRYNHVNRNVLGLLAAYEITPQLSLNAGYTYQDNDARGVLWGSLPLLYTNGTRVSYPVSASTSAPWTFWNVTDQTAFSELGWKGQNGWQARGRYTYNKRNSLAKLLYGYGYADASTGLGNAAWPGIYRSPYEQHLFDGQASGPVKLLGREHQIALGVSHGSMHGKEYSQSTLSYPSYASVTDWAVNGIYPAEGAYDAEVLSEDSRDKLTRVYGALHANITDQLKGVFGASAIWLRSSGVNYGTDMTRRNSALSPYAGLVFDATKHISLYASYTDIYNPQKEVDVTNNRLAPAKGTSIEGGIKSEWFDKRLYASAAIFRAKQTGLAEAAGVFGVGDAGRVGTSYYRGVDTTARGFELEINGQITPQWSVSGGYTGLEVKDQNGNPTRTYLPTKSLKLASTYAIPAFHDLKLGGQLRWQNAIRMTDSSVVYYGVISDPVVVTQKAYAVLDLMASAQVVPHVRASLNLRNVGNAHYLGSLKWGQGFYAAPRSFLASVQVAF